MLSQSKTAACAPVCHLKLACSTLQTSARLQPRSGERLQPRAQALGRPSQANEPRGAKETPPKFASLHLNEQSDQYAQCRRQDINQPCHSEARKGRGTCFPPQSGERQTSIRTASNQGPLTRHMRRRPPVHTEFFRTNSRRSRN